MKKATHRVNAAPINHLIRARQSDASTATAAVAKTKGFGIHPYVQQQSALTNRAQATAVVAVAATKTKVFGIHACLVRMYTQQYTKPSGHKKKQNCKKKAVDRARKKDLNVQR